jgi:hypothetical protein
LPEYINFVRKNIQMYVDLIIHWKFSTPGAKAMSTEDDISLPLCILEIFRLKERLARGLNFFAYRSKGFSLSQS